MTRNSGPEIEAMIVEYMPLVGHIVRETMTRVPSHVDRNDLTSAGLTALVQAAQAFEAERGVPFKAVRRDPDPRRDRGRAAQHRLGVAFGASSFA